MSDVLSEDRESTRRQLSELYLNSQASDVAPLDVVLERREEKLREPMAVEGIAEFTQGSEPAADRTVVDEMMLRQNAGMRGGAQAAEIEGNSSAPHVDVKAPFALTREGVLLSSIEEKSSPQSDRRDSRISTLPEGLLGTSYEKFVLSGKREAEATRTRFPGVQVVIAPDPPLVDRSRALGLNVQLSELKTIILRWKENDGLVCKGPPCPVFSHCAGTISSCWQDEFVEEQYMSASPFNYPPDSHVDDHLENQYAGQVFIIENAYVNVHGTVFNETHKIDNGGCRTGDHFYGNATQVKTYDVVLNMVNWHGRNFFHVITETLSLVLVTERVRDRLPRVAVLVRAGLKNSCMEYTRVVNASITLLNTRDVDIGQLAYSKVVIQATAPICGRISRTAARKMRRNLFKINDAKYQALADRTPQQVQQTMGDRWKLVLLTRKTDRRRLVDAERLRRGLVESYGAHRVVEFWGNLTIEESVNVFHDCVLLLGTHGAGLANMVFQPPGTHVLEIRPRQSNNRAHHTLADMNDLKYHLIWGTGQLNTPTVANITDVLHAVWKALPPKTLPTHWY